MHTSANCFLHGHLKLLPPTFVMQLTDPWLPSSSTADLASAPPEVLWGMSIRPPDSSPALQPQERGPPPVAMPPCYTGYVQSHSHRC